MKLILKKIEDAPAEGRDFSGEELSPQILDTLCPTCIHFNPDDPSTCEAFPGGIPMAVLTGFYDHRIQYSTGEVDDGGITYEKKPA